jgi:hypothetical protein
MAVFAIGPAPRDIGGYGGSSPREIIEERCGVNAVLYVA